jgi:excisionase family DNA binding protein
MATSETARPNLFTVREASSELRCSRASVYRAVHDGRLSARRLGEDGSLRISAEALDEFLVPVAVRSR